MDNNQTIEPTQELTKKERKELRREERFTEKQKTEKKRSFKRVAKIAVILVVISGSIGAIIWYFANVPPVAEAEVISKNGLHWHPNLEIFVNDEKKEIPANIGLGMAENPIHTHDATGVIHLEFSGLVRQDDIKLGRFFKVWDKDFSDFGSLVGMLVNGKENMELGNYKMQDGDKIELNFEQK